MSSPRDTQAPASAIEADLGKRVGAVGKQLSSAATKSVPKAPSVSGVKAELAQLPAGAASSPFIWVGAAALALGLAVLVVWLWRRHRAAAPKQLAAPAPSDLDLYGEWRAFRKRLPARIKRVLDDFQPVILLGNTASEKEQVALQLSGVAERERELPGKVSLRGEGLSAHLGSRSVVLVPSEAFLRSVGAEENASWRKLLRTVCAVRAPRVVVCLSQAPLDAGDLAEITAWASTLRRHIDLIVSTRNEDIEVSVTLAQAPLVKGASLRLTDALFELLSSLSEHEGVRATLSAPLAGLVESLSQGSEDRRRDGERWAAEALRRYRRGWPRLLAHPDQTASRLLTLAQLFEHFPRLSSCLGAALGELFVSDERQRRRGLGQELVFLPARKQGLSGALTAFAGPRDDAGRWHPSRLLLHRLGVASGVGFLAVVMWLVYASDRAAWDTAATAALRYDPPEKSQELKLVRDYLEGRMSRPAFLLPEFFERDLLRCLVVDAGRRYLHSHIDQAVRALSPPESVLQLTALYLSGTPTDCGDELEPVEVGYRDLGSTIEENLDQWRQLTELSSEELSGYLSLACPQTSMDLTEIRRVYSSAQPSGADWQAVPDAARFGADLQMLRGVCSLTDEERDAIERAEVFAEISNDLGQKHGAAYSVLRAVGEVDTSTMSTLATVFGRYRPRLAALENLAGEHDELELLARDVRPFSDQRWHHHPLRVGSLEQFTGLLGAFMAGEIPEGEDAVVRMTFDSNTFVIDRWKVRASLLTRALGELRATFTRAVEETERLRGTPEAMFFDSERYEDAYTWIPASVIPAGVELVGSVPRRYTIEGFQRQVLEPLEDMQRLLAPRVCASTDRAEDEDVSGDLSRFVRERLDAYLVEYGKVWQNVYASFHVTADDDAELGEVLLALSRPSSPQLALLREVLRETALTAGDGSPFAPSLALARAPFETLPAAADEKAFGDYRTLVVELANASQPEDKAASGPAPGRAAAPNAEQSLDDLMSGLSGFGRVVLAGLRDPKQDLRARARAWAQGVALAPTLRGALLDPFDAAYASGEANLALNLGRWWESKRQELEHAVYWRFPFNAYGNTDALVADVITWLEPREGRFFNEVQPIHDLVNQCSGKPCVTLPASLGETVRRTNAIARTLFDDKGTPKPIALQIEPVPFQQQRFAPRRSSLRLETIRQDYFNTAPRGVTLSIPWNEARVARLEVELVGEAGIDGIAVPIDTESSPWAAFHLLQRAVEKASGRYQWELDVTGRGVRVGKSSVSYRVCQDVTLCNGLFTEALQWL